MTPYSLHPVYLKICLKLFVLWNIFQIEVWAYYLKGKRKKNLKTFWKQWCTYKCSTCVKVGSPEFQHLPVFLLCVFPPYLISGYQHDVTENGAGKTCSSSMWYVLLYRYNRPQEHRWVKYSKTRKLWGLCIYFFNNLIVHLII